MSTMLSELSRKRSLAQRIGLDGDETRAATWLRVFLAFLKEAPGVGWTLKGAEAALDELADEADDAKLLERFDELLRVGSQTNEAVAFLTELSKAIFVQTTAVLQRLEQKGLLAEPEQVTALAKEMALVAFRNKVTAEFRDADHRGVEGASRAQRRYATSLPLEDVYVLPRLVPERERAPLHQRESELLRALLDLRDAADPALITEYAVLSGERWKLGAKKEEQDRTLSLGQALADHRRAVVIGGPGVGKTVLTRYLARMCALGPETMQERLGWSEDLVPVRLPLATFAEARRKRSDLFLRAFLDEAMEERGGTALREAIAEQLAAGRVLVLLDGVDEVSESAARAAVVQAVDRFLVDHDAAWVIVTSRPYGYIPLAGDLPHFTLPNFSPEQVMEFVHKWQRACEIKQHPEAPDLKRAEQEATLLLEEIRQNPRVAELSSNPLMLVIVSFIRLERARLPEQRVQLYNAAVNTLMDTWNQWRSQLGVEAGGATLPVDRLVRVWGAVAEWMRRTRNTGVAHRAELERKLVEVLRDREYDEDDPEATARAYLQAIAGRAGLLEERGPDIFAFWHPTFEEFLAAVELATPTAKAADKLLPLADDPRWREVILLAIGYIGIIQRDGDTATDIVRRGLEDESVLEPLIHPRLRLAAAAVADNVGIRRSLVEEVIVRLAGVIQRQPYWYLEESLMAILSAHGTLKPSAETLRALLPLADVPGWNARILVVRLLSNVASENQEAHDLCKHLLRDPDSDVRIHAAIGLARAGECSEAVLWELSNGDSISSAKIELVNLLRHNEGLRAAFISMIESKHSVEPYTAELLQLLGVGQEALIDSLKRSLASEEPWQRFQAANVLVSLGVVDSLVLDSLKTQLTSRSSGFCLEAAKVLVKLDRVDDMVLQALNALLIVEDSIPRYEVADLLVNLNRVDAMIVNQLKARCRAEDPFVCLQAAGLLNRLGAIDATVVSTVKRLISAEDELITYPAVELLVQVSHVDQEVLSTLRALILENDNVVLQILASRLLVQLNQVDDAILNPLKEQLLGENPVLRYKAAEVLVFLHRENEMADTLIELLSVQDMNLRFAALHLLSDLSFNEKLLEPLTKLVLNRPFTALAAWQRLLEGESLGTEHASVLAKTIEVTQADSPEQQIVKEVLFRWLWEKLNQKEVATA